MPSVLAIKQKNSYYEDKKLGSTLKAPYPYPYFYDNTNMVVTKLHIIIVIMELKYDIVMFVLSRSCLLMVNGFLFERKR